MPRTPDHAASAQRWLAQAEQAADAETEAAHAAVAQAHATLAVAAYLGAARVRPRADPRTTFDPDWLRDADEAAIDRVRAASATDAQRGMRGERPSLIAVDEMEEPGWHRSESQITPEDG